MFTKTFLLFLTTAIVLSACGTMNVSIEQAATPAGAVTDPTKTTLEMEATSMSAFVTQQAATMIALTPPATPTLPYDPSRPWKTYQDHTFGFTMEYPAIYDEPPYGETCGLKASNEGIHLGRQLELRFLYSGGLSLEEYTSNLLAGKDWRVEVRQYETVSSLPAITMQYRFGGTDRFGMITLVEYNGLIYAFGFTEGDFCEIPGNQLSEDVAFYRMTSSFRILAVPTPQPPTPYASPDQVYPILVFPPYDSRSGFLLGGSRQGQWQDSTATAADLKGDEAYAIYADNALLGYSVGTLPAQNPPFCPAMQEVSLHADDPFNSIVALGPDWNALPRIPQELPADNEIYRQVIDQLLVANGIPQPEVRIDRVLKVDLEGDGVYEVLISASRFADGKGQDVEAGDYSVVVLRKVSGDAVLSIPLVADYYPQSQPAAFPDKHLLTAVLDLNGDGRMEIVVSITGWEKTGALGYEVDGAAAREILQVRCAE